MLQAGALTDGDISTAMARELKDIQGRFSSDLVQHLQYYRTGMPVNSRGAHGHDSHPPLPETVRTYLIFSAFLLLSRGSC